MFAGQVDEAIQVSKPEERRRRVRKVILETTLAVGLLVFAIAWFITLLVQFRLQ
jgi:hypothetical protein